MNQTQLDNRLKIMAASPGALITSTARSVYRSLNPTAHVDIDAIVELLSRELARNISPGARDALADVRALAQSYDGSPKAFVYMRDLLAPYVRET